MTVFDECNGYPYMKPKQRMVSGIKPSGELHIGNYLGAIRQWVDLQEQFDLFLFVADLHAITVPQDPEELRRRTIEVVRIYLAAGLDPAKTTLFVQSQVPEHAQLGWILNTITKNGDLTKMTQFKDKSGFDIDTLEETVQHQDPLLIKQRLVGIKEQFNSVGVGLFDYPVLMSGDILLYGAEKVPVGEDQVQHVELTRTLARRFNKRFGDTFTMPQPLVRTEGARIMALDNPTKKMSKSAASEYGYVALGDTPEAARRKIMKAMTDSGHEIVYVEDKPALRNLVNIYTLLTDRKPEDIVGQYLGAGYADFKKDLADVVASFLEDFQGKLSAISDEQVEEVLRLGAGRARMEASAKLAEAYQKVGFLRSSEH